MDQTSTFHQSTRRAAENSLHVLRLNIGPRLILCFAIILLAVFVGDAVVLWQIHLVRAQAEQLNGIDQKLVVVLRFHTSLLAVHDKLEELTVSEDAARLVTEAGPLRTAVLEEAQRAKTVLSSLPSDLQRDPTVLPTLEAIQSALPVQLDAITALAKLDDWSAVRQRVANEIRPLNNLSSALVEKVDHEVGEEQAEIVQNTKRVEQRVFLAVPITAVFTFLVAGTLGLGITRSITQPLERLVEGSKALALGDFQYQVAIVGEDELAHLGRVFNDTARQLRDLYANLQKSEDRLRLVIDTIPALVWSARPDGSVDFVNQRWEEYTGLSLEEGLGWKWGDTVHPDDIERFVREWRTTLASGEPMRTEVRVRRADGEYRWLLVRNVPLRDENGNIVKWYGSSIDIEDRKQAEEASRKAQADLAHVARVVTMGELVASISHEVNQPLTGIVAHASTCLRWLAAQPPDMEEARQALGLVVKDGRRAAEIIGRIRALVKKVPPRRDRLDINTVILEVIALTHGELRRNRVELRTQLSSDLPLVPADRVQLQQVILNLIVNAMEAMSGVGDRPRELVVVTGGSDSNEVFVEVRDSGPGLDPANLPRLFESFYTTKQEGMGMGLSISRSIIDAHGGRLWATPNKPHGAVFRFTLTTEDDMTS